MYPQTTLPKLEQRARMPEVRTTARIYGAGVVLGATLSAAVWRFTYRTWSVVEYIDRTGRRFHPSERVRLQPWWGVPATLVLLAIGIGASIWLLPQRRRLIERFSAHLVKPSS
jgi:hypothetical protein